MRLKPRAEDGDNEMVTRGSSQKQDTMKHCRITPPTCSLHLRKCILYRRVQHRGGVIVRGDVALQLAGEGDELIGLHGQVPPQPLAQLDLELVQLGVGDAAALGHEAVRVEGVCASVGEPG